MNKYYQTLDKILQTGKIQTNRKGRIKYLLNERLMLTPADLLDIFESHGIARKKLKEELKLFMQGVRDVEKYKEAGITWWDYCGHTLVNSYPTYFEKLPPCLLYTSDAADEEDSVDLGGRRIITKKKIKKNKKREKHPKEHIG